MLKCTFPIQHRAILLFLLLILLIFTPRLNKVTILHLSLPTKLVCARGAVGELLHPLEQRPAPGDDVGSLL